MLKRDVLLLVPPAVCFPSAHPASDVRLQLLSEHTQIRQPGDSFYEIKKAKCLTSQLQCLWVCCRWVAGAGCHLEAGMWHPDFREDLVSGTALATEVQPSVCVSASGWGQQFVRTLEKQVPFSWQGKTGEIQPYLPHSGNERRERERQEMMGADPSCGGTSPWSKVLRRCLSLV